MLEKGTCRKAMTGFILLLLLLYGMFFIPAGSGSGAALKVNRELA